jgi:hypothetical protein
VGGGGQGLGRARAEPGSVHSTHRHVALQAIHFRLQLRLPALGVQAGFGQGRLQGIDFGAVPGQGKTEAWVQWREFSLAAAPTLPLVSRVHTRTPLCSPLLLGNRQFQGLGKLYRLLFLPFDGLLFTRSPCLKLEQSTQATVRGWGWYLARHTASSQHTRERTSRVFDSLQASKEDFCANKAIRKNIHSRLWTRWDRPVPAHLHTLSAVA